MGVFIGKQGAAASSTDSPVVAGCKVLYSSGSASNPRLFPSRKNRGWCPSSQLWYWRPRTWGISSVSDVFRFFLALVTAATTMTNQIRMQTWHEALRCHHTLRDLLPLKHSPDDFFLPFFGSSQVTLTRVTRKFRNCLLIGQCRLSLEIGCEVFCVQLEKRQRLQSRNEAFNNAGRMPRCGLIWSATPPLATPFAAANLKPSFDIALSIIVSALCIIISTRHR